MTTRNTIADLYDNAQLDTFRNEELPAEWAIHLHESDPRWEAFLDFEPSNPDCGLLEDWEEAMAEGIC